jgi:hypothetical protein
MWFVKCNIDPKAGKARLGDCRYAVRRNGGMWFNKREENRLGQRCFWDQVVGQLGIMTQQMPWGDILMGVQGQDLLPLVVLPGFTFCPDQMFPNSN